MTPYFRVSGARTEPVKIDLRDKKILSLLSSNSRMPVSSIAKKTNLNRDTVTYKINRLEEKGVLEKTYARIWLRALNFRTYHAYLSLGGSQERRDELIKTLAEDDHTLSLFEYVDRWDLEWTTACKNLYAFDDLFTKIASDFSDVIQAQEKLVTLKHFETTNIPFEHPIDLKDDVSEKLPEARIDLIDLKLLQILSKDSRMSSVDIAPELGLSSDSVIYRIKKLQEANIITKYTCLLDMSKLGYALYTLALKFKSFTDKDDMHFKEFIKTHPYVFRCIKTLGEWDVILYISAENQESFQKIIHEIKGEFFELIRTYETWMIFKEHIFNDLPKSVIDFHKAKLENKK